MTDSDRMNAKLAVYREAFATYTEVIQRRNHTDREVARAEFALFRASLGVAHFLNELVQHDQAAILDIPADYHLRCEDDDQGIASERREKRAQFEALMAVVATYPHEQSLGERGSAKG